MRDGSVPAEQREGLRATGWFACGEAAGRSASGEPRERRRESSPKLVLINGPLEIGKSTVAEIVFSRLPNPAFLDRGHGNPVLAMWDQDGKQVFAPPPTFALELLHE